jgi:outer membrane receptor protein involved in Fe transport
MRTVCLYFLMCLAAFAQMDTGSVNGTVTDSSGAQVPDAKVRLTSELTGTVRDTVTNAQGYYTFPLVPSGRYKVSVEREGFKTSERSGITLQVNQQVNVPVTLDIGQVTEQVSVSGTALLVETTSGAIRETVDHQRITELPLNGRNVLQLQSLLPGTVPTGSLDQGANTPGFAVNGGTGASNNYSLDGGQHQDAYFNGPLPFPNPDAIQEFSVQTSSYSAEFGRNRGASINAVTKSGSNQFHGGAFEFLRNDALDARPFFSKEAPAFKRNQFGAHLGGPIRRNQTFFFFAWQQTRERGTTNTSTATVPTALMRMGDLSQLSRTIRDPETNQPFPGNIIPANRLNQPAMQFLDRFVPLPNFGQSNYVIPLNRPLDGDEYVARVDHDFSTSDRLYVRYLFNKDHVFNPAGNFAGWGIDQTFRRQSAVINETHLFSPTLLNSLTLTFNRVKSDIIPVPDFAWSEFGANIPPASPGIHGWHSIGVSGYFTAANGTFWDLARNTYNVDETLSWTRGRHSVRLGAQISRYQVNQVNEFLSRGQFSFNGFATGDALADFMLGRVNSLRQVSTLSNNLRQTLWQFFAQDDIKVTSRFMLNLGVRWEPNLHFRELSGKLSAFRPGEQSTVFPNAPDGLLFKGDPQLPANVAEKRWLNFAPRVGFAYDVTGDGRTAIRGGYGIFYDTIRSINLNRFPLIQPFVLDISVFDVNFSNPYGTAAYFPFDAPRTPEERRAFHFITPAATTSFNEDFRTPYTQQWNLNVQQQLPWNIVTTAAYIGSKSSRLFGSHNINPAIFQPGATVGNTQSRRIFQDFGVIEDESTVGYSQYHSFQLTVNKRLSNGFTLLAAYTLSKNTGLVSPQGEGSLGTRDPFNWNLDRGVLGEDRTHVLSISSVWNLPSFGSTGVVRAIVGGWELSGILSAATGAPLTVRAGQDRSLTGQNLDTADLVGNPDLPGGRSRQDELGAWFSKAAFALPPVGTVGTSGINILRGPGSYSMDAGLFRNFRVTEAVNIQFRAQFYNALNHTRLNNPDTNFSSPNFGRILGAQTPRVGELGLKILF